MEVMPTHITLMPHHINFQKNVTLWHRPIISTYHSISLSMITSFIYIWGGFQNNTLKDILLLHIFWLYGTIAIVWRLITTECKECNQEAKKFYFLFYFFIWFYYFIIILYFQNELQRLFSPKTQLNVTSGNFLFHHTF